MSIPQSVHPYLRDGWKPDAPAFQPAYKPMLPDVNPADTVVQRMRARLIGSSGGGAVLRGVGGSPGLAGIPIGGGGGPGGSGGAWSISNGGSYGSSGGGSPAMASLTTDVSSLQTAAATNTAAIAAVDAKITGASISAVCNGDGTITVTLTWGS